MNYDCTRCCDTGKVESMNSYTLTPCMGFCDCKKGQKLQQQRYEELNKGAKKL